MADKEVRYKLCSFAERNDTRNDIYCAIELYRFLDDVKKEVSGMELQMDAEIQEAQQDCIEIACKWINLLKEED